MAGNLSGAAVGGVRAPTSSDSRDDWSEVVWGERTWGATLGERGRVPIGGIATEGVGAFAMMPVGNLYNFCYFDLIDGRELDDNARRSWFAGLEQHKGAD